MSKRILIVEDDALLAMSLVQELEDVGYDIVGPCMTVQQSEKRIHSEHIDGAVIDMKLGNETSAAIAVLLKAKEIPFVVVSGYDEDSMIGPFAGTEMISKPYNLRALVALLPQNT